MDIVSDLQEVIRIMTTVYGLSFMSVVFHVLAYVVFIFLHERRGYEPNPTTWIMFAYGDAFVALLEWSLHAPWTLLALPVVCSILSMRVAFVCWRNGSVHWPEHALDRIALITDIILLLTYGVITYITQLDYIDKSNREALVTAILIITLAGAFLPFVPMLRGLMENPRKEHWAPWLLWTVSYVCLTATTVLEESLLSVLMLYPVVSVVVHAVPLYVVLFFRKKESKIRP